METKYERYYTPRKPEDPDAEYLDAAETAWVFKTGVKTIQRRAKELDVGATIGRRKMFSREDRRAIYEMSRAGNPPRVPAQRRRKPAKRATIKATQTPAAA